VRRRTTAKPRLLVFNQYYWPGFEATAHLLSELCEALASDFDVAVVTGITHAAPGDAPGRTVHNGVDVIRVRSSTYDRSHLFPRAMNYVTYLSQSLRVGARAKRPAVVLCMTDPPLIANVALLVARRFRAPLVVVSQDVFPEIAVKLKRLQNPFVIGVLDRLIAYYLRRADRIVAIGETMRRRLEHKGAAAERIEVIPNWVDTARIAPVDRRNEWSAEHGLDGKFVVMHSGNVGYAQNLDALIRASTFLRDLDDLVVAIIGAGARYAELVDLADRLDADAVRFLPYQPRELLSQSLSTAALHYAGLAEGLAGYVVPSRLYGILSSGRPVLAAADAESETAQLVAEIDCGVVVPPSRPDLIAAAIRRAHGGDLDLDELGRNGRRWVVEHADRAIAVARYRELLLDVAGTPRTIVP
jgi:colanic acid biosynthesis glycosyl transferase WcaI